MKDFKTIVEALPGWCTAVKAEVLYDLILKSNSQLTVELGVFGGRSLVPLAMAHQEKQSGYVLGVDPWKKEASLEGSNDKANDTWWAELNYDTIRRGCNAALLKYNLDEYCALIRMWSNTFGILIQNNTIDVLHQDSNHSEEVTCREVELFKDKVRKGGYWISDDTNWSTVQKSLAMLEANGFQLVQTYAVKVTETETTEFKVFQKII